MPMTPRVRKLALTAHVVSSVGWLGAVCAVLALALAGLVGDDPRTVRAVYVAMDVTGWSLLVPLSVASLVTGIVQGLGTPWGLVRHYWVLFKLLITIVATAVLLLYTQTLAELAAVAASQSPASDELSGLRSASPVLHAAAGVVLLLAATALAIYKPRGLTRRGWRAQQLRAAPRT